MSLKLSKQEIVKEIVKSGKDPVYFINNYCRISHPLRGLIPFNTYPYQDDLIKDFNDYRFNVILKARQLGSQQSRLLMLFGLCCFTKKRTFLLWQPNLQQQPTWSRK